MSGGRVIKRVMLFGVGSPLIFDVEESLHRLGGAEIVGVRNRHVPVLTSADITVVAPDDLTDDLRAIPMLVPLFTPANRLVAAREAAGLGLSPCAAIVDPTSILPRDIAFGDGSYVNAGCTFSGRSRFGPFTIVGRSASIGHDAKFGAFTSVGPGTVAAGFVTIGDETMLGAGCVVLPGVTIGSRCVVSAGAVVTRDIPSDTLVRGIPARQHREAAIVGDA